MAETVEGLRAHLATKVKSYEGKVAALNAINSALQKENTKLRKDLSKAAAPVADEDAEEELQELREEFALRLGAADRAVEALKEEKARLQQQLQQATAGGSASEYKVNDLQATIDRLKAEGDALSKRNGEAEAALRKLRTSSRDLETERDRLAARSKALEGQVLELQDKLEKDAHAAAAQIEELEHEVRDVRVEAKKQVAEARREAAEALARFESEAAKGGAELLAAARERELSLNTALADLRETLEAAENEAANREDSLRRQVSRLEERIRGLEAEKEELAASTTSATKPLLKQIESMAAATAAAQAATEAAEAKMVTRLRAAEAAAVAAADAERVAASRCAAAEAASAAAGEAAMAAVSAAAELRTKLEAERRRAATLEAERQSALERLTAAQSQEECLRQDLEQQRREAHEKLWDTDQRMRGLTLERDDLLQRLQALQDRQQQQGCSTGGELAVASSNLSLSAGRGARRLTSLLQQQGRNASTSSLVENGWDGGTTAVTTDEVAHALTNGNSEVEDSELDGLLRAFTASTAAAATASSISSDARSSSGLLANGTALDSAKVQRTLELLQARLAAAEAARTDAAEQLFIAIQRADEAEEGARAATALRQELRDMEQKVDVALELLGERNERVEQLEDDIDDMKRIFKEQLLEAVNQLLAAHKMTAAATAQSNGNSNAGHHSTGKGSEPLDVGDAAVVKAAAKTKAK